MKSLWSGDGCGAKLSFGTIERKRRFFRSDDLWELC